MKGENYYRLRKNVLKELTNSFSSIQDTYKYLKKLNKHNIKVLGASEWILDNTYLVEKEYKCVKKEMPLDYFKGLPCEESLPRIFNVAKTYISVSRNISIENMEEYINTIQGRKSENAFTMGELWAFPLMLKASLIINLSKYTEKLKLIQEKSLENKYIIDSKENYIKTDNAINSNVKCRDINNKFDYYKSEEENNLIDKNISGYISCIRQIDAINWKDFFKKTSIVEKILENDPVNVYRSMDFESQDYYRHKIEEIARIIKRSEIQVVKNALKLAEKNYIDSGEKYKSHIGYYLVDEGTTQLDGFYYTFGAVITEGAYLGINLGSTALISALILLISTMFGNIYTRKILIIAFILVFISVNEIVVGLINWLESKFINIRRVPKLDFSRGIPYDCKTVVVIPAIVDSKEKAKSLIEKLEVEYCGNMDNNIFFALLSDFPDSDKEVELHEKEIIDFSLSLVKKLNEKYAQYNGNKEDKFYFLSRKRIYNKKQKVYMGKERKRGKLMEFMALIRGSEEHTYDVISSDISPLKNVKYLITLDEDTFMPRETVIKLVGAMKHILNIPYMKKNKVVRGYGIMQPKVSISLEAKNKTYFSKIFAGNNSVDGYSVAYSDTYEDLFGEGTFVGKGILDIDEFYGRLKSSIKENRILSHDLLEGALCRCALVSDVEFIDDYPSFYESSCRRLHRWVRGDWQLLGWLFSRKISLLNKWKIVDNLKRSLLAPNLMLSLILSLTIFNGNLRITLLCFLALIMSLVFTVTDFVVTPKNKLMGTFKTLKQIFLIVSFIPYQAFLMMDAIITTLIRLFITKRNLLEWKSSQFVEDNCSNTLKAYIKRMWISPVMAIVIILLALDNSFGVFLYTVVIACLWIISPYIAYAVSEDIPEKKYVIDYNEKTYLREISRRIYAYYEDFINEENNYLAPDNYQVKPYKGVAYRTSPTNMGMGIISEIVAYDLGYITLGEFIEKIDSIITNMNDLKREQGHFYNWYDTRTKEPLYPRYISTVDSGNLLANLWILKKSMEDLKDNPVIRTKEIMALKDIYKIIEKEYSSVRIRFASSVSIDQYTEILEEIIQVINKNNELRKLINKSDKSKHDLVNSKVNEEAKYWIRKLIRESEKKKEFYELMFSGTKLLFKDTLSEKVPNLKELKEKYEIYKNEYGDNFECAVASKIKLIESYLEKIDKIINYVDDVTRTMNFKFLYDEKRELFSIGYNVEKKSLGSSYYDLLASESRIASFVAIAKNDVPKEHWFKLGRSMTNAFHSHALISWSGTMFEYFMPSLIMKAYPNTLLKRTYKEVLKAQRVFAKQKKIPWGISESAFYEFDNDENYQYKAFGIPGLGLKRGLEDEIVVSPYSTLMSLSFSRKKGFFNLNKLEEIGALGRYGFIEAIDYTKARKDKIIFTKACTTYTQNVDKSGEIVDKYENKVDNDGNNICSKYEILGVESVDKNNIKTRNEEMSGVRGDEKMSDNPQKDKLIDEKQVDKSYPQGECSIFGDGIRPNKIMTYMVHHLGMSIMALENMLLNNSLIERFHGLPQVKATELLLKERVPEHVTYERYEDYTIKNNYIEGHDLLSRDTQDAQSRDKSIVLLSNSEYSIMLNNLGSGYSSLKNMMLYRWKGQSTSDSSGMFFYIKNLNSNEYWSASFEPCKTYGDEYKARLDIDKPEFSRKDGNIETNTQVTVSSDENFEVRKITLKNNGTKGRSIEITSYMEIVLTNFSADVVHPAFSNLFVQTEYDEEQNVIIGSRRGRVKGAKIPYIYHKVVYDGSLEGNITYETSRINFIGRNRTLKNPKVMDNDKSLENTVGTVLDPIISLRARVRLEAQEEKELYFITGACDSKEDALEICRLNDKAFKLERLFEKYHNSVQLELRNLEITPAEANAFQDLAADIFYLNENRKNRENYIKNISKHQKDLWAFGISGDIPIVLAVIDNEEDINLIMQVLKFYYYMRSKGVNIDLIIYNNEELSYDEPLQKSLMTIINKFKEGNIVNNPTEIHLYNKSTMNDEMRDFLIGICRIYINFKKGSLISQIAKIKKVKAEHEIVSKANTKDSISIRKKDDIAVNVINEHRYEKDNQLANKNDNNNNRVVNEISEDVNDFQNKTTLSENKSDINNTHIINNIRELENNDDKYDIQKESSEVYEQYDHDVDFLEDDEINEGINTSEIKATQSEKDDNLNNNITHSTNNIRVLEDNDDKYDIQKESSEVYNQYDHDIDFLDENDISEGKNNSEHKIKDNKRIDKLSSDNDLKYDNNAIKREDEYKTENLDFFNGYGGFSKIDGSYIIKLSDYKNTPAPWINVMSNEDFGFHISESGSSYTWCGNSRENKITPWSNDYITDPLGEALYIKDDSSGKYFSISPKPVRDSGEYIIKHGFGYSKFTHSAYHIKGKLEVFAPRDEKVKIQKITLENLSDEDKEISLYYYAKMVLGVYEYDSSKYITTEIEKFEMENQNKISTNSSQENLGAYIAANNPYSEYFGNLYAYLTILGGNELRFSGDTKEFLGNNGELSNPEILKANNDLSNRSGSIYDPCLAASVKIFISKGKKAELVVLLGQDEKTNISKVIEKYMILENAEKELKKVKEYWHNFLGNIQVKTPSKSMNYLLNGWLLYQTYSCRYLSRSAFYQSGGAYGFRDQLQDSMALGVVEPEITKAQILRSASRQYTEGDVQHWWHPVVNSGIRTRFSDDLLWLPYVVAEYINSTGDYDVLEKTASYLEDEPLKEGEDERYTIVNSSSKKGTIYEHCLKAIERSLKFGPHNIPLMGSGDWNDGMSTVGNKGKGESVWLGWFIYSILDRFIKIAEYKNDIDTKNHFEEKKEFIKENIEKNAWDGGWYRRAYFDDGTPLGSRENPECQIDSIAQSWSVISGAAKVNSKIDKDMDKAVEVNKNDLCKLNYTERAVEALEAVDKNLVKIDRGMILLLAPPFNNSYLEPGYIKGYVPGVRENGGQYTHAAVWVILALTKLGLGDKAVKYYDMINPINHTNTELECATYKLEPYVMAADVYIKEPHGGRGGWSWYTGASGWMYKVGVENILGLTKVEEKGYVINPCVPKSWNDYEIRIKNEKEDYYIHVKRRTKKDFSKEQKIYINLIGSSEKENVTTDNDLIPRNLGKAEITVYFS